MFYYFGRKKQTAKHYPKPIYDKIIEPFAGSAAYSLLGSNWEKEIFLIEKDKRVADIWHWLIGEATPEKISALPDLAVGEKSTEFLHIIHAVTKMAFAYKTIKATPVLIRNWEISKRHMAENLYKVKHWKIVCGDYSSAPPEEATWFIDPPYQNQGKLGYAWSAAMLDYKELARWVESRKGQVICCEGGEANYLPFRPLVINKGVAGRQSKELLYYKVCGEVEERGIQAQMTFFENEAA